MELTLNQFLLMVLTMAAVVAVTVLVIFLLQLKRTAKEAGETLGEIRNLVSYLQQTSLKVNTKLDEAGEIVEATRRTALSISEIAWFLAMRVIKPSSKYWPFIFPLIKLGWRQLKKQKKSREDKK